MLTVYPNLGRSKSNVASQEVSYFMTDAKTEPHSLTASQHRQLNCDTSALNVTT